MARGPVDSEVEVEGEGWVSMVLCAKYLARFLSRPVREGSGFLSSERGCFPFVDIVFVFRVWNGRMGVCCSGVVSLLQVPNFKVSNVPLSQKSRAIWYFAYKFTYKRMNRYYEYRIGGLFDYLRNTLLYNIYLYILTDKNVTTNRLTVDRNYQNVELRRSQS